MRSSTASAERELDAPIDAAWRTATLVSPVEHYSAFGPLPAVTAVHDQSGEWDEVGKTRTLALSGGDSVAETITDVSPNEFFAYDLSQFSGLFGKLVEGARAEWDFWETSSGCGIRWTYTFHPRAGSSLAVALIVRLVWARYMRVTLAKLALAAERESTKA